MRRAVGGQPSGRSSKLSHPRRQRGASDPAPTDLHLHGVPRPPRCTPRRRQRSVVVHSPSIGGLGSTPRFHVRSADGGRLRRRVAALSVTAGPVSKITILPTGMSLGATHQLPRRRAAALHRAVPARVPSDPAGWMGRGVGGVRPSVDRRRQRPGWSDRPGRPHGPWVRPVGPDRPVAYPLPPSPYLGAMTGTERPYAEATQRQIDTGRIRHRPQQTA